MRPLRQRFEVVDRLTRLHFDYGLQLAAALQRLKDEVGINGIGASADGDVPLDARVHPGLETSPALGLKQPDDTVVLELLADWPDKDGAHPKASPAPGSGPSGQAKSRKTRPATVAKLVFVKPVS